MYVDPYAANVAHHNTTLLVIRELPHTMLVCSTAHTFHFRWFVRLVRTLSTKDWFQDQIWYCCKPIPHWYSCCQVTMVQSISLETPTSITEELKLLTLCNLFTNQPKRRGDLFPSFFFFINTIMTTETSPLSRQPDQLDYSSPTQFRFILNQIPKVQFFLFRLRISLA